MTRRLLEYLGLLDLVERRRLLPVPKPSPSAPTDRALRRLLAKRPVLEVIDGGKSRVLGPEGPHQFVLLRGGKS